ncbi:hypothetical protein [Streptomyces sp. VNUA24]|uniref:hypothetical protein n=1 Tax=Streptomyces sp. VNUA24 TaxID=3031131 RepID=UPI0023B78D1F|nr:hypothetical protein [Streptomyces sp. VNUA24]WEH19727.1 hypothetical protein PYR72_41060 [Streptomyces sp. VNUA24]
MAGDDPRLADRHRLRPGATEAAARTAAFLNRVAEGRVVDGTALLGGPATLDEV